MNILRIVMYRAAFVFFRIVLFFAHPVLRVTGKENLPEGGYVLCGNHSGAADPLWILLALRSPRMIRILSKKELRRWPFCGWYMRMLQVIFIDRSSPDSGAYDECVAALKNQEQLLIFVEGTRCHGEKHVPAKTGALRMSHDAGVPMVPVYVTKDRKLFAPVDVRFGTPCRLADGIYGDTERLHAAAQELLATIYEMGEKDGYTPRENSGLLLRG